MSTAKAHITLSKNPTAGILIIGNEILSGRTQEANINYLCTHLGERGIAALEARIIPDQEEAIIDAVQSMSVRYTYLFTTGGIGGTHDDITAASIAKAVKAPLQIHPEAMMILENYYGDRINEARRRMAWMPAEATLIENPISRAPGFQIKNIFVLAGVPSVMQAMFQSVALRLLTGKPFLSHSIQCPLMENNLAADMRAIQEAFPMVEIGSYPYFDLTTIQTTIVLRSVDETKLNEARKAIEAMVQEHLIRDSSQSVFLNKDLF